MIRHVAVLALLAVIAACAVSAPGASAQTLSCGQVITKSVALTDDLVDCPGDGLVVGADGITVDLNGHSVTGRSGGDFCETDCLGRYGIDSAGHDGLTIENGTVGSFRYAVYLHDTTESSLSDLSVGAGPHAVYRAGILLLRSHANRLVRIAAAGDPTISLVRSTGNTVADSILRGDVNMRQGDGLTLAFGSDRNRVVDTQIDAPWMGLVVYDSARNRVARVVTSTYVGNEITGDHNVVVDSRLAGGKWEALNVTGDRNRIARNELTGNFPLYIDGDHNEFARNEVGPGLIVRTGNDNLLRGNQGRQVLVAAAAGHTALINNSATGADQDGFTIEAAGTLLRRNTANNNGNLGINAVPGVIDAGGNRASGNGNPLECLNVFCR